MTTHLVLDHSALTPCGDKPEEEKRAIRILGDELPTANATWCVSRSYLRVLLAVVAKEWRWHHPLPKLQASVARVLEILLSLASTRRRLCRPLGLRSGGTALKIHVVARTALKELGKSPRYSRVLTTIDRLRESLGLTDEDAEVLAIAVLAHRYTLSPILVTADDALREAAHQLTSAPDTRVRLEVLRPSELLAVMRR